MDVFIIRYESKKGFAKKLLGLVTFTDGKTCAVWDEELHQQCKQLEPMRAVPVKYTAKHSEKWGWSLKSIALAVDDADAYSRMRQQYEDQPRSHKQGGYVAERISKRVQQTVDQEQPQPGSYERVMERE